MRRPWVILCLSGAAWPSRELQGPRLLANGPSIDGDPALGSNSAIVRNAAEARAAVNELKRSGADFIKVYENLSRDVYFAIMDHARRRRIPVDGQVPFRVTPVVEAAEAGQRTVENPEALAAACSTARSTTAAIPPPASPPSRRSAATVRRLPPIWSPITM